jgi:hypothetical protein
MSPTPQWSQNIFTDLFVGEFMMSEDMIFALLPLGLRVAGAVFCVL